MMSLILITVKPQVPMLRFLARESVPVQVVNVKKFMPLYVDLMEKPTRIPVMLRNVRELRFNVNKNVHVRMILYVQLFMNPFVVPMEKLIQIPVKLLVPILKFHVRESVPAQIVFALKSMLQFVEMMEKLIAILVMLRIVQEWRSNVNKNVHVQKLKSKYIFFLLKNGMKKVTFLALCNEIIIKEIKK